MPCDKSYYSYDYDEIDSFLFLLFELKFLLCVVDAVALAFPDDNMLAPNKLFDIVF